MVVEEGKGEAEEKTEGRPPSGLIKSITSASLVDLARDSPLLVLLVPFSVGVPSASRRIRITVPFSPSLLVLRAFAWPPARFPRGQLHHDRLFTLILILLPAVRLS